LKATDFQDVSTNAWGLCLENDCAHIVRRSAKQKEAEFAFKTSSSRRKNFRDGACVKALCLVQRPLSSFVILCLIEALPQLDISKARMRWKWFGKSQSNIIEHIEGKHALFALFCISPLHSAASPFS
jgi:hypothetical protein